MLHYKFIPGVIALLVFCMIAYPLSLSASVPDLSNAGSVNETAQAVLSQITKPGLSKPQIAAAIYNYVKHSIAYTGTSDKESGWEYAAMKGFQTHSGDCFTFFATAKALFNAAGIPNVDVIKLKTDQTTQSDHYWSLIDVGSGWYHVDCTPRAGNETDSFFLYTDQQMLAYSTLHSNCFHFDANAYPARQDKSMQAHIEYKDLKVRIKCD